MATATRRLVFAVALAMGTLLGQGSASAGTTCHPVTARGVGQDLGQGHTVARIFHDGLRLGSTAGTFTVTGSAGTVVDISGTIVFTGHHGRLTVSVTGTLDTSTGHFHTSGPITASAGVLAGATGTLTFDGTENLGTGRFVERVTGTLCVDVDS